MTKFVIVDRPGSAGWQTAGLAGNTFVGESRFQLPEWIVGYSEIGNLFGVGEILLDNAF